jgi:hypothetical protein
MKYSWTPLDCSSALPIGMPFATPHMAEDDGRLIYDLAFDDCVPEVANFSSFWAGGNTMEVDLVWRSAVASQHFCCWQVGITDHRRATTSYSDFVAGVCYGPEGSMASTRLVVHVPHAVVRGDMFTLHVIRQCADSLDTMVGDALLMSVAGTMIDDLAPADASPSDVIPDEEYARRAGIYRGPK